MSTKIKIGFALILLVLVLPNVLAVGITPGRNTVDYEQGKVVDISVSILNKEKKEFDAIIYVEGLLKDYVELSDTSISFKEHEMEKQFSYKVSLPDWFAEKPGSHDTRIIVREIGEGEEFNIDTLVAVAHQLRVNVVYPGVLAETEFIVQQGTPTKFILVVFSVGEEDILNAKGIIEIFDMDGNKITTIETNEKGIESKYRRDLVAELDNLGQGFYYAVATLNYDGKTVVADRVFSIGDIFLNLLDISVKNFRLGEIAKFNILVENIANVEVKDARAEMFLKNEFGMEIAEIRSLEEDIGPKEKKELLAFWDTENVEAGSYKGKVVLSHAVNRSIEKLLSMQVLPNTIITSFGDITGYVVEESPAKTTDMTTLVLLLILLLIVVNISWIVYVKKRKK